ncbi:MULTISPECIES: type II secretion system F family protein [unclassified Bordetella]|uniref:type II secretion system F family protein n=1 Tax=unclassified Bordetella TaxID=2630031 RepID=UPI001321A7A5|nr:MULTISPECIES: type II secretion system F family protein [unclassified Bordetella]MVW70570.1 type II secretion protein F [Bordetella sp. 15P40C-2]MVW79778.1 type II secretion protein F [Bordetella sp. 02P26C-1]
MLIGILYALALVLVLFALLLWQRAQRQQRRQDSAAFLNGRIQRVPTADNERTRNVSAQPGLRTGVERWDTQLRCAGIKPTPAFYTALCAVLFGGVAIALLLGGVISAIAAAILISVTMYFGIWLRASKRRARMFDQLPEMLDNMVRMITIGHSMSAAFQSAAMATAEPLREVVERAAHLSRTSQELDAALTTVARLYDFEELHLLASVVRVAQKYGGRSDVVLERIAAFMRDLAQARAELVAASAEIRLSAWVLALMPLGIACYIMITNNAMFMGMWNDEVGFKMLMMAAALQAGGSFWLYRMTKSI